MVTAKDIKVHPVNSKTAGDFVKTWHYSGKVATNSCLHFGAFINGKLEGVAQFGPPINKRAMLSLVRGTRWQNMVELNRLALSDRLPKNSESRFLGVIFRIMRKNAPHIKWVLSFADATQCGDGAIYRASGFKLVGVKKNSSQIRFADGRVGNKKTFNNRNFTFANKGKVAVPEFLGEYEVLDGFQVKYIKFIDHEWEDRLTVPVLPFTTLDEIGARMYKGKKTSG